MVDPRRHTMMPYSNNPRAQELLEEDRFTTSRESRRMRRLPKTKRQSPPLARVNTTNTHAYYHVLSILILWYSASDIESFSPLQRIARKSRMLPQVPFLPLLSLFPRRYHHRPSRHRQSLFGPDSSGRDELEETESTTKEKQQEDIPNRNRSKDVSEEIQVTPPSPPNGNVFKFESPTMATVLFKNDGENVTISNITDTVQAVLSNVNDIVVDDVKDVSVSCRIVASSDGKIPTQRSLLPASLYEPPDLLAKLDAIYHATSHEQTRNLQFMEKSTTGTTSSSSDGQSQPRESLDADEEANAIRVLRHSLEDSGFNLMNQRDLDLCQALNAEYLLRLSILEDLSELDGSIAREFYPERFETVENSRNGTIAAEDGTESSRDFLYNGRVLLFWRGYGQELTRGRLLLPKIDYLQASIVQRAASQIRVRLNVVEEALAVKTKAIYDRIATWTVSLVAHALQMIPSDRVAEWARVQLVEVAERTQMRMNEEKRKRKEETKITLQRYGGSTGALAPFMICEVGYENGEENSMNNANGNTTSGGSTLFDSEAVDHDIYEAINRGQLSCQYDKELSKAMGKDGSVPPMQLLERVSISNLVDFSPLGTRNIFKTIFGKNELLEPTYQEVIVVWRPLPPKPQMKPVFTPPKFIYDFADMFDIEGLPDLPKPEDEEENARPPLEIRAFASVPMANLPAVLPKTKLVFRPADAFVFDLVSIVSLILVIGSQRFDNPRLDLLALVSFSLWLFRTVIRYSNKLARYDLLVKKFLTSKITARNSGALKYVSTEAGSYRATRAALVYTWLTSPQRKVTAGSSNDRHQLIKDGLLGVNGLIGEDKQVRVDIGAALRDLEELKLVVFSEDGERLEKVIRDNISVVAALTNTWASVFGGAKSPADVTKNAPSP